MHQPPDKINQGHHTSYKWIVIGLFALCNSSGFMITTVIGILLPSIANDLSLTPTEQGMLGSAPFLANVALTIVLTWWASRFPPKLLTSLTMVFSTFLLFFQGITPNFMGLLLARLLFGITTIMREPARALLIRQWLAQREVNLAGSIFNLSFGIVVGGGLFVAPLLLKLLDNEWRLVMHSSALLFLILSILWIIFGKENRTKPTTNQSSYGETISFRDVFCRIEVWLAGIGMFGAIIAWTSFNSFLPTLLLRSSQISLEISGLIIAIYILVGGVSGVLLSYRSRSINWKLMLTVSSLMMTITYFYMTYPLPVVILILLAIVNGTCWGFFPLLYMIPFHIKNMKPRSIAISVAIFMTMNALGSSIGPTLTGFLEESTGSLTIALRIISISPFTLIITGFLLKPPITSDH